LLAPHRDRFVPLFTINPAFPGWEEDLDVCVRDLGLAAGRAGLRLHAGYHQYALDGPDAAALLARAAQLDVPVAVSARLEDERTHHWLVKVPPVSAEAIAAAIVGRQGVRWLVCGLRATQIRALWRRLDAQGASGARVLFDLSLVQGPIDECRLLVEDVGAERLAFGTGLPLTTAEAPALALACADLAPGVAAQIAGGNAAALFGLEP
jgi:predicted TIM-barrel fold metal-dependent hydrolase